MIACEIDDIATKLRRYRATGLVLDPTAVAILAAFFEKLAKEIRAVEQALGRAEPPAVELTRRDPRAAAAPPWGFGDRIARLESRGPAFAKPAPSSAEALRSAGASAGEGRGAPFETRALRAPQDEGAETRDPGAPPC